MKDDINEFIVCILSLYDGRKIKSKNISDIIYQLKDKHYDEKFIEDILLSYDFINHTDNFFYISDLVINEKYKLKTYKEQFYFFDKFYYNLNIASRNYLNKKNKFYLFQIQIYIEKLELSYYDTQDYYDYIDFIIDNFINNKVDYKDNKNVVVLAYALKIYKKLLDFEPIDSYLLDLKSKDEYWNIFMDSNFSYILLYYHIMKGEFDKYKDILKSRYFSRKDINSKNSDERIYSESILKIFTEPENSFALYKFFRSFLVKRKNLSYYPKTISLPSDLKAIVAFFIYKKYPEKHPSLYTSYAINLDNYSTFKKMINDRKEKLHEKLHGIPLLIDILSYFSQFYIDEWDIEYPKKIAEKCFKNGYHWIALEIFSIIDKKVEQKKYLKKLEYLNHINLLSAYSTYKSNKEYIFTLMEKQKNSKKYDNNVKTEERILWIFDYFNKIKALKQRKMKNGNWSKGTKIINSDLLHKYKKLLDQNDLIVANNIEKERKDIVKILDDNIFEMENFYSLDNYQKRIKFQKKKYPIKIYEIKDGFKVDVSLEMELRFNDIFIIKRDRYNYDIINLNKNSFELLKELQNNNMVFNKDELDRLKYWIKDNQMLEFKTTFFLEDVKVQELKSKLKVIFEVDFNYTDWDTSVKISPYPNWDSYFIDELFLKLKHKEKKSEKSKEYNYFIINRDIKAEKKLIKKIFKKLYIDEHKDYKYFNIKDIEYLIEILEESLNIKELELKWSKNNKKIFFKKIYPKNLQWSILDHNNWFQLNGKIQFDENETILLEQFLSETEFKEFYLLENGDILTLTKKFKKMIKNLKGLTLKQNDKLLIPKYLSKDVKELIKDGLISIETDEWSKNLDKLRKLNDDTTIPKYLDEILRDYQKIGAKWIIKMTNLGFGVALADDMGLGKTIQTITAIVANPKKAVVIVPASVLYNWKIEIEKFAPKLNPIPYEGEKRKLLIKNLKDSDVVIVSYDTFQIDSDYFYKYKWGWVVLDESQMIKNDKTKRAKAIFKLRGEKRVALSGTPIENHLGELWSLFHFLDPILLNTKKEFNQIFVKPILNREENKKILLKNILSPFLLRRLKKDVLKELPEKTEIIHWIELKNKEKVFYEALRIKALKDIENNSDKNGVKRIKILSHLTKLRQASCDISLLGKNIDESSKTQEALNIVKDTVDNGYKTLVFSQFTSYLKIFEKRLKEKNINYLYLDGSTTKKRRAELVKKFQTEDYSLFLISLRAGGTGLNLTAANYVIHLDPWWNPAVEDQATDRTHRIGQNKNVFVYKMIVKNSIEEKIIQLHKKKRDLSNSILDNMDKPANKLSIDELIDMLK